MTAATARQLFLFGISTLFAVVAVGLTALGFFIAYDRAWERWPQEADLATLWTMEIFRVGSPEQRFGGALANRDGERLMHFMLAIGFDPDRSTDGVSCWRSTMRPPIIFACFCHTAHGPMPSMDADDRPSIGSPIDSPSIETCLPRSSISG